MGIRFESNSLLNWTNEMGKFLRLLVDEQHVFDEPSSLVFDKAYGEFFKNNRDNFLKISGIEMLQYAKEELDVEQIRPLALVLMHDGLRSPAKEQQHELLSKAKLLLNYVMKETSSFAFEDYGYLATIDSKLSQ
ncbi:MULTISPECIES: hypothetical protein [Sphingobacterium]|jgi:hypothetical protein|uniref:hypothetical protein n=1 Tax=Sphingobacterium TaxID=28453 RepID=UPI00097EC3AC|nr:MULTISPECIES: hypothetical protein [Sphingobacterium]SJN29772.1 hypothetical protein FM120_06635 [Sphingobacterium faecium PCAi_F2.5]HCU44009.1 hypothetical protein [Sphingobacterium sp.]UPZ37158.1 hypothetical protein MUB18_02335 [Sphingobacterium sp. PCS056]UXD68679.1 hypothetical protein MUK51_15915 [Sphingobacterium faecium]WGQ16392.1 hypothetical protein QG727_08355 [Sphingobacterium faecium]